MKRLSFRLVSPHELRRAIHHAQTADAMWNPAKKDFISTATHQMRSPLMGMKWTLNMLAEEENKGMSDVQISWIKAAYESNERVIKMIDDMLHALRAESRAVPFVPTEVDLGVLVHSLVDELSSASQKKHLGVSVDIAEDIPQMKLDEEKMRVALQNLIHNAIKYTPDHGSVSVVAHPDHDKKEVHMEIRDTGIGIPEAERKDLFRQFFRGSNAMQADKSGTGLGLYITKNVIERHGGKIWFDTELDKGTTFHIMLPFDGLDE